MYFYRIFVLFTLYYELSPSKVASLFGSCSSLSGLCCFRSCCSDDKESSESKDQVLIRAQPGVTENPLDLKSLKGEYGLLHEADVGTFNFRFYRAYVGQNFNKVKMGSVDICPKTVCESSVMELFHFYNDKHHLVSVAFIGPDCTVGYQHVYFEEDGFTTPNSGIEDLTREQFCQKFNSLFPSVFKEPFPNKIPKSPLIQAIYCSNQVTDANKKKQVKVI